MVPKGGNEMATGQEIAKTTLEAYECKGGYIWGQQGAEWTAAKQANLEKKYNADPEGMVNYKGSATYGKQWIGHRVWDCAGLSRWAAAQHGIAIHSGSNLIWKCDLSHKGKLTSSMDLPVGAQVFTGTDEKKPHIGTYTGDGIVTEASGARVGVIQSKLHDKKWKYWGLEKGVTYDFIPDEKPEPDPGDKKPILRKGDSGAYVKLAQTELMQRGYDIGKWGADGKFGDATEKAVKQFQTDWGLTPDGIIGPRTWEMLSSTPATVQYYVIVPHMSMKDAQALAALYPGAKVIKEDEQNA